MLTLNYRKYFYRREEKGITKIEIYFYTLKDIIGDRFRICYNTSKFSLPL